MGDVEAGLIAYYDDRAFAGIGFKGGEVYGLAKGAISGERIKAPAVKYLRIRMNEFDLSMAYSDDARRWTPYPNSLEVSGYHQNVLGGFSHLKLGIFGRGLGVLKIDDFVYRNLE